MDTAVHILRNAHARIRHVVLLASFASTHFRAELIKLLPQQNIGCLLAVPGNPQYSPGTIVDGNCAFDFDLKLPVDLPHCPATIPIALVLIPKCASTSLLNWLATLDGTSEQWEDLANSFHARVHGNCDNATSAGACSMAFDQTWKRSWELIQWVSGGLAPRGTKANLDTIEGQAEIQYYYGQRFHAGLLPYPQNCIPCCSDMDTNGAIIVESRLRVVAVRNPFSRLMAYFQRAWLRNEEKAFSTMAGFLYWVEALQILHKRDVWDPLGPHMREGLGAEVEVRGRTVAFSLEDLYHTRPVASVLLGRFPEQLAHDLNILQSCSPEGCWLQRDVFTVHTESVSYDLALLGLRLCLMYDVFCEGPLPPLAHLNERAREHREVVDEFWISAAGRDAAQRIISVYAADFILGSYGDDPAVQTPLQAPIDEVKRWLQDSSRRQ
eukprot:TRINITY_DN54576_c0_g1_i1.p1 TRINITY_DN54576_c0_g1~~TRINITY_DN54576_c0_g1_i1.p1  ORF type:complete len:456 (+),score=30.57 TRINITY_DN54576_c0_g1_i1:55-1368(+)